MIRLAVTDLDGCFLGDGGVLPRDFPETFALLRSHGVVFAAASGRAVGGASKPFTSYQDKMAFVSDNGSCVYYQGEPVLLRTLPWEAFAPVVREARKHPGLIIIATGLQYAWIENMGQLTERDWTEIRKYYPACKDGTLETIPEPIIKCSFLWFDDIEKNILPSLKLFEGDRLSIQATAYVWVDAFERTVNKGTGVAALQEKLGVTPAETVVFGDYLNDLPMADHAARSFAPANAHPRVKERFTDTIGPNTDGCVTATLKALLREEGR